LRKWLGLIADTKGKHVTVHLCYCQLEHQLSVLYIEYNQFWHSV